MSLLSKNKLSFVDGTILPPSRTDSLFVPWERCNNLVISWLIHSISSSIAQSIIWLDSAYEIWNDLKARFAQSNSFRICDLQLEIYTCQQGVLSVHEYFTKLKILWDELQILRPLPSCSCNPQCSCGLSRNIRHFHENDQVMVFIKGLNENYATVKSQILLMDPLPSLNKAFSLVIQQERPSVSDISVLAVKGTTASTQRKFTSTSAPPICTHCGKEGHTVDRCYKKHGYPINMKNSKKSSTRVYANAVDVDVENNPSDDCHNSETSEDQVSNFQFTKDQYEQILQLLQGFSSTSHHVNAVTLHNRLPTKSTAGLLPSNQHPAMEDDWGC
ncbi:hypothetical protein K2173_014518 [Erythroxylum novogranatense]|uniref:CCHC-type domain-containing protein n=1 Tax=Erythroxylum novogranatense TaxID=1862640 RepID=A0AAV8S5D6_9ROSI|nr:hypothetical protein K2173_014518 [Erythroxylum novogranatense]